MTSPTHREKKEGKEITPKQIHNLIVEVCGKNRVKTGYCYIESCLSHDTRLEGMNQETLQKIYQCFDSRIKGELCLHHKKIHKPKLK